MTDFDHSDDNTDIQTNPWGYTTGETGTLRLFDIDLTAGQVQLHADGLGPDPAEVIIMQPGIPEGPSEPVSELEKAINAIKIMKPLGPAEAPALAVPLTRPIGIQVSTYDIHVPPQVTESYKELGMYGKVTHTLRACQQVGWAQPVPPPQKAEPKPSTLENADSK